LLGLVSVSLSEATRVVLLLAGEPLLWVDDFFWDLFCGVASGEGLESLSELLSVIVINNTLLCVALIKCYLLIDNFSSWKSVWCPSINVAVTTISENQNYVSSQLKTHSVPEEFDDPVDVEVLYLVFLLGGGSLLLLALEVEAAFGGGCFLMAPFLFCTIALDVPALTTGASGPSLSLLCSGLNMLFVFGCCLGAALFWAFDLPLGVVFEAGAAGFRTTGVTVAVALGFAGTLRCLLELFVVGLTGTESSVSEE
jgi:hypothetical protein